LLKEKEWLLKEIHHRVKNNLHMVTGLLGTQAAYLKNEEAVLAITDSQHRVQAMSLIHQKLYQSEHLSATDMPAYIHDLVEYLRDSFGTRQRIRFQLQIEKIDMELSHTVSIGLILNEAITNAIKYAFPGDREGDIVISLESVSGDEFLLSIADNGIGLPADFKSREINSLGMSLMKGLSEDIGGQLSIENHQGTEIKIKFVYHPETAVL
jgi:two-component system, sensor histidine kinase PdtaS